MGVTSSPAYRPASHRRVQGNADFIRLLAGGGALEMTRRILGVAANLRRKDRGAPREEAQRHHCDPNWAQSFISAAWKWCSRQNRGGRIRVRSRREIEPNHRWEEAAALANLSFDSPPWTSMLPLICAPGSIEMLWVTISPTTTAVCLRSTRSLA